MRYHCRVIQEKRLVLIFTNKVKHVVGYHLRSVSLTRLPASVSRKGQLALVLDKESRIEIVCVTLTVKPDKMIESHIQRITA